MFRAIAWTSREHLAYCLRHVSQKNESQHGDSSLTFAVAFSTLSLQLRYLRNKSGSQRQTPAAQSPAWLPGCRACSVCRHPCVGAASMATL